MSQDMKECLTSKRKPDITHVRKPLRVYAARACEYGDAKYERANYLRPTGSAREDFLRLRSYLRATLGHIEDTLDSMELHQAGDPQLEDVEGMRRAAYAIDTDAKPGCPVGASRLPHLAHAAASLNMVITQAVTYGLLPEDPGRPWEEATEPEDPGRPWEEATEPEDPGRPWEEATEPKEPRREVRHGGFVPPRWDFDGSLIEAQAPMNTACTCDFAWGNGMSTGVRQPGDCATYVSSGQTRGLQWCPCDSCRDFYGDAG